MRQIRYQFPKALLEVHDRIVQGGYQCYLVGGAVRNLVLKKDPKDWDLASDASPNELIPLFHTVIPTGVKHGTVTILHKGCKFEITTFRMEGPYSDSRHPDHVEFTTALLEDLKRRDFTINAMAIEPAKKVLIDPYNGQDDCSKRIIRALGDPAQRFAEDALRILRAVRFNAQLGFHIEDETLDAMRSLAPTLSLVSAERIRDEMEKIIASPKPSVGFQSLADVGILPILFPELENCRGVSQKGIPGYDVFIHSILCCDAVPVENPTVRWAALLHDLGKPSAKTTTEEGGTHFHRHEQISAFLCREILHRLRFPLAFEKRVAHLVQHHMFQYEKSWSDAAVRRFIRMVGKENLEDLFALREADSKSTLGNRIDPRPLTELRKRITHVFTQQSPLSLKDLAINGEDLAREGGIPKGPAMGTVLNFLLETVLEDPTQNDPERLLQIAKNFYQHRLIIDP